MRSAASRAYLVAVFAALLVTLTACADSTSPAADDSSTVVAQPPIDDISITTVPESDPGASKDTTNLTPSDELPAEVRAKLPTAPPAAPTDESDHAHRKDTKFSGELPEAFTIPASGKVFEPASVFDGDRSYIALEFNQPWEQVAQTLKDSLKSDGWECVACRDVVPVKSSPETDHMKYRMEMTNGTRTLYVMITFTNGKTGAGLNFQP